MLKWKIVLFRQNTDDEIAIEVESSNPVSAIQKAIATASLKTHKGGWKFRSKTMMHVPSDRTVAEIDSDIMRGKAVRPAEVRRWERSSLGQMHLAAIAAQS